LALPFLDWNFQNNILDYILIKQEQGKGFTQITHVSYHLALLLLINYFLIKFRQGRGFTQITHVSYHLALPFLERIEIKL